MICGYLQYPEVNKVVPNGSKTGENVTNFQPLSVSCRKSVKQLRQRLRILI